jgi:hypothetical protein
VGGVVVWLAGHAHLSCLNLRQWITIGVDIHSFPWTVLWGLRPGHCWVRGEIFPSLVKQQCTPANGLYRLCLRICTMGLPIPLMLCSG